MQIFKLKPYCTKAIWGGTNLYKKYGKSDFQDIAESWELSGYPNKESAAQGGIYDGKTISKIINEKGWSCLGDKASGFDKFPILIKFIDAAQSLSIQVHPNDEIAKQLGAFGGKTEMWIILDCEPGSFLYMGVKEPITKEKFRDAILDGTITEYLNKVYVKPGDTYFISAGTIHAIGAGITICEIQQTSDTTYRLFDFKRKDKNGNERELHIEQSMVASILEPTNDFYITPEKVGNELKLVNCPYFNVSRIDVDGNETVEVGKDSFATFTVTEGDGYIQNGSIRIQVGKGTSVFALANAGKVEFYGRMSVVKSTL
jgi:mannose-6-phosphate isomerase